MASNAQPLPEIVACSVCGKNLDPEKPLQPEQADKGLSRLGGVYCVDCWLRALRPKTAESLLAKTLERVLLE